MNHTNSKETTFLVKLQIIHLERHIVTLCIRFLRKRLSYSIKLMLEFEHFGGASVSIIFKTIFGQF